MKCILKTTTCCILILLVGVLAGLGLGSLINWYKSPPGYHHLSQNFVFSVAPKFTNYFLAVTDLFDLKYSLSQETLTDEKKAELKKQLPKIKKRIDVTNKNLDHVLKKAIEHYGNKVKPSIDAFLAWKKKVNIDNISHNKDYVWGREYNHKRENIYKQLRKASGYYNIDIPRNALAMQMLPKAEAELKKHPNDPKLCTVMEDFTKYDNPKKTAQRMAFIRIGDKFCNQYFHKRSAWGLNQREDQATEPTTNPYEKLPYAVYYEKEVLPWVADAMKQFKDTKNNASICNDKGLWGGERNPKRDALRLAYRGEGKKYCPTLTKLEKKNYLKTSYFCMIFINEVCNSPNRCDVFERCKPMNGALFPS